MFSPPYPPRVCIPRIPQHKMHCLKHLAISRVCIPHIHLVLRPSHSWVCIPRIPQTRNALSQPPSNLSGMHTPHTPILPPIPLGYAFPAYTIHDMHCRSHLALSRVCIPHILNVLRPSHSWVCIPHIPRTRNAPKHRYGFNGKVGLSYVQTLRAQCQVIFNGISCYICHY